MRTVLHARCMAARRRWSFARVRLIVPPKRIWRGKAIDAGRSAAMPVTHELWLVVLSIVVAIQGAYVGLSMAVQVGGAVGLRQRLLLAGSALSLGVAIWSMHFVGMLAATNMGACCICALACSAIMPM